jgi:hypothetical protein
MNSRGRSSKRTTVDLLVRTDSFHRTNFKVGAGRRVNVGRVQARDSERALGYRWGISYHADSSDAKAMALLRENGIELDPAVAARRAAQEVSACSSPPPAS